MSVSYFLYLAFLSFQGGAGGGGGEWFVGILFPIPSTFEYPGGGGGGKGASGTQYLPTQHIVVASRRT